MEKHQNLEIIRPDDWHTHLREGDLLKCVLSSTTRIVGKCIAMPNLTIPITTSKLSKEYKKILMNLNDSPYFKVYIPCYLIDNIDLKDFQFALKNNIFIGAKLYPLNSTTNSNFGISDIDKIYPALEVLEKLNKPLLVHAEKNATSIDIFDREKYFIDDELSKIIKKFPNLKIVFEHVSSKYGADFVANTNNIVATITVHHMLLTKKDVFKNGINAHNYCMPVVKNEEDLVSLRFYACSGNKKFFLGTDSAPHLIQNKINNKNIMPGIFSAPCSIELYATIFEEENSLSNLENFTSINGSNFYELEINNNKIILEKHEWIVDEYTYFKDIMVKNFFAGRKINWKIKK